MRVLKCPLTGVQHVDVLAPQLLKTVLSARGLDERWAQPLTQDEMDALCRYWPGGSIRNLRRLIEGVLAARDKAMRAS